MKQTKTTLKELTAAYRAVFRHSIIAFGLIATVPAIAETVTQRQVLNGGVDVDLSLVTASGIDAGSAYGAAYYIDNLGGIVTVSDSEFSGNVAATSGAIEIREGSLNISDSTFTGNSATTSSGAIETWTRNNVLSINNSTFEDNYSPTFGAVSVFGNTGVNTITGSTFSGNRATATEEGGSDYDHGDGAAIYLGSDAKLKITDTEFTGNQAGMDGGAISTRNEHQNQTKSGLEVAGATFTENTAGQRGGAIYANISHDTTLNGAASIKDSTFTSNSAANGGAIYVDKQDAVGNVSNLSIVDTQFTNNTASDLGGAIYNNGIVSIAAENANVTFSGNKANDLSNDIYNVGTLNLDAASGKYISLTGGITGSADTVASNIVNVAGSGYVSVNNTLTNQTVNNAGDLRLDADLSGTTINNTDGAKITLARDITVDGNSTLDGYNGELVKDIEVKQGGDLTINNATFETGGGKLVNNNGATLRINDSLVKVVVDNSGNLISDPTTYTDAVNNAATGIASFDADIFTGTATLANAGVVNLSNGVTFESGAEITDKDSVNGVVNLTSGVTHFNDTSNTNTINVMSYANFDGTISGGMVNTQNGVIDTIAGSIDGSDVAIDVNTDTHTSDTFAGATDATIKSVNVSGAYGDSNKVSVALGSGLTLDSNASINGGYYTKVESEDGNLVFSDKLINESNLYNKLGSWSDGNYIQNSTAYDVDADETHLTVGQALSSLDTAVKNIDDTIGTVHGLITEDASGNKSFNGNGTSTNMNGTNYVGNLAVGTTVEDHLVALDNTIGTVSGLTGAHVTAGNTVAQNLDQLSVAIDTMTAGAIETANTYTDHRIESLDKNLSAGVAGAVALSSVAVSGVERGEVSVGAGYGYFNGQSAAAFGAAMGLSNRWSVNAGAGVSNADVSFRAGTNYKFKLF